MTPLSRQDAASASAALRALPTSTSKGLMPNCLSGCEEHSASSQQQICCSVIDSQYRNKRVSCGVIGGIAQTASDSSHLMLQSKLCFMAARLAPWLHERVTLLPASTDLNPPYFCNRLLIRAFMVTSFHFALACYDWMIRFTVFGCLAGPADLYYAMLLYRLSILPQ